MRLNRCLLGSGHAPILVIVGLQRLRIPWTNNSRKRQPNRKATRRKEKGKKNLEGACDSTARFGYAIFRLRESYSHITFSVFAKTNAGRYGDS
jgi:hypothetical protein